MSDPINWKDSHKLPDRVNFENMLDFEKQIFLDILDKDGLVVAAKGLNLDLVITNLLKVYCDPGNLVIVLNAREQEEKYFIEKLNDPNVHTTTYTTNIGERGDIYLSGGINFVTTRILVVDMLKKRIPIEKITGVIVLRAHTIFESCQEAFVMRLYRQNNKTGFVKAFSNNAQSFTVGFGHVERVMRALFVTELIIWPRFHSAVIQSLKKHVPHVIELHVPISEKMKKMQATILDLMNLTVKELKRINTGIELQEITVENCLTKMFLKILQAQLDVVWHQLNQKSLELINDLKTLRHLIVTMLHSDPVTFYSVVSGYRSKEYAQTANWVFLEPADFLFSQVGSIIFNANKEFDPEFCPKWEPLLEILKLEIPNHLKTGSIEGNTILILCSDYRTCHQLMEVLTNGPHHYLFRKALKYKIPFKSLSEHFKKCNNIPDITLEEKSVNFNKNKKLVSNNETETSETPKSEESCEEEMEDFQNSYLLKMSQTICKDNLKDPSINESNCVFEPFTQMENMDITQVCQSIAEPKILIQTFKADKSFLNFQHALESLQPNFIIMYHCSMVAVREIEMYEAHRKTTIPVQVYSLLHAGTVEEQSYLTTLRREKECFELLIQTKSTMVVPEYQDGKTDQCITLERAEISPVKNTREGGKELPSQKRIVIVDIREFRSELPALIHKRGIEIEPLTITIGDYILTPNICVERKSLSDLIGSLASGRLYQQCKQMSRYYAKPMLLIEFDKNKPFGWQNYLLSANGDNFDIQKKLLLLTIHFPKIKIIWSPSAYATAQLFDELKVGKEEPNVEYAAAVGGENDLDAIETKYNSNIYDFVQKLPGITSKNIDIFMKKAGSMDKVIEKTEVELKELLGNAADAQLLYSILHKVHKPKDDPESDNQKGKSKVWRKYLKS